MTEITDKEYDTRRADYADAVSRGCQFREESFFFVKGDTMPEFDSYMTLEERREAMKSGSLGANVYGIWTKHKFYKTSHLGISSSQINGQLMEFDGMFNEDDTALLGKVTPLKLVNGKLVAEELSAMYFSAEEDD